MGGFIPRVLAKDWGPCAYVFPRAMGKSRCNTPNSRLSIYLINLAWIYESLWSIRYIWCFGVFMWVLMMIHDVLMNMIIMWCLCELLWSIWYKWCFSDFCEVFEYVMLCWVLMMVCDDLWCLRRWWLMWCFDDSCDVVVICVTLRRIEEFFSNLE